MADGTRDGQIVRPADKPAAYKFTERSEHRVVAETTDRIGSLAVTAKTTVEYDGMVRLDLTLKPEQAMRVRSLRVVIPLRPEVAEYLHASGEGIRYGFDHRLLSATRTGRLWDSTEVDSQHMVVGSFIPFVFVGNRSRGLAWFADSDQGWSPTDSAPAIQVRRDNPRRTDLVLNLIGDETTLNSPRTITFALEATPVKPMHPGWRMDSWWCGDTFQDFSAVEKHGGSLIWTSIPFTMEPDACRKMVEERHKGNAGFIQGVDKYRANAVPYFENNSMGAAFAPEIAYFGDQWKTSINGALCYDPTLIDFVVYHLGDWARTCGIDGWYVDNVRPEPCDNLDAGRGYRLPDGRVQPTYQGFANRTLWLRVRAAFAEQGKHDKIVLHMTNHMVIPWIGAGDIAYDGEHNVIYPEMGKDFMDYWSPERLRADCSDMWGVAVNFMHEYQGNWNPARLKAAMQAYTGMVGLFDALPSGDANGLNQAFWIGLDRFGIQADDVEYLPYWESHGIASGSKEVLVSAWKRPGKLLLLVVNRGEAGTASIRLDPAKLGLRATGKLRAVDLEAGTDAPDQGPAALDSKYELTVRVARHNYRQIEVAE